MQTKHKVLIVAAAAITAVAAISLIIFTSHNFKTEATAPKLETLPGAVLPPEIAESVKARFLCDSIDENVLLPTTKIEQEESLSPNATPFAGIVSHHLLAHTQIDAWFAELARQRQDISTFLVLSPSHWNLSTGFFSVTFGSWVVSGGASAASDGAQQLVGTDFEIENKLKEALDARIDDAAFASEHGVSALAPYIKKYFPQAEIAAVIYSGEPPLNQPMAEDLCNAVSGCLDLAEPQKDSVFLLVSSDFSHHQNPATTKQRDERSRLFLENPQNESWILAVCDNRPAMYLLGKLLPEDAQTTILCNTNSYELCHEGADDITSYFFCFFSK
ncbi:MAG: AmmeMemoRadiSam system protein B, partial [Spirochaetaceae bacterium]|nr:AmmeMemoRadiSam system protein B [Spirochaetaceae bacterium]